MGSCICAVDPQELKPSETLLANDRRNMGNFQANPLIVHQTACRESEIATVEWYCPELVRPLCSATIAIGSWLSPAVVDLGSFALDTPKW
ncbi:hypothetical protein AeRB84_008029 [Aphanomyces euteiches]|nr:hypothetical protein AeRB84_008029 [Aphanomyces euteiches]